jgi:O-antigen/teichoic acid export membrane protein
MMLPLSYVTQVLSQVLLPAYSRVQDDRSRMTRGYLASVYLVFVVAVPTMMFVLVAAPYLIRVLFGPRWEGVILPLQVFAIFGAFRATYNLGGAIAQASGRPWSEFLRQLLYASLVVGGAAIGSRWGIVGVAWGTGFAIVFMYVAMARLSHRLLRFPWSSFAGAHGTGVACGLLVLAVGVVVRQALRASHWPDLGVLVCLVVVCVGTAVAAVSLLPRSWRPDGAERVVSVAFGMMPRRLGTALRKIFRVGIAGLSS